MAGMRLFGMGVAAALAALAGAIVVQSQGYADVNIGFGVVINALAAMIIGELLLGRRRVHQQLLSPVLGSIVYAQVISMCLALGLAPTDLKLASGVLVLAMLALPRLVGRERAAQASVSGS